jgi:5,10-methylenetetrahydrofolate reductase
LTALRGDLPNIDEKWQYDESKFNYAYDMVKHIRQGDQWTCRRCD